MKDDELDLTVALRKLRELSLEDGDIGYAYWTAVAKLLASVPEMRARIEQLEQQLRSRRRKR